MKTSWVQLVVLGILACSVACGESETKISPTPVAPRTITVSADVACSLAASASTQAGDSACGSACGDAVYNTCNLPAGYTQAFAALNPPGASPVPTDAAGGLVDTSPAAVCPVVTASQIEVTCERVDF